MSETKTRARQLRQRLRRAGLPVMGGDELFGNPSGIAAPGHHQVGEDGAAEAPPVPEGFRVHDEATANWLVRKIRECRLYADSVSAWAAAETRRARREEQFLWDRYGAQLEQWAASRVAELDGRGRSVRLPAGTVGFRELPPSVQIIDEQALLAWLTADLPEAMKVTVEAAGEDAQALRSWLGGGHCAGARVTTHVVKGVVAEHVRLTGECPPGTHVGGGTKFFVK